MRILFLLGMLGIAATSAQSAMADAGANSVAVCLAMVKDASHNVGLNTSNNSFLSVVYDNFCEQNGEAKTSGFNAGLSAIIDVVPVKFTLGASSAENKTKNFCKNYQSVNSSSSSEFNSSSIVVQKALDSANECLAIANQNQSTISYKINTPQQMSIRFAIPSGQNLELRGISHDNSVTCEGSKSSDGGIVYYNTGVVQKLSSASGGYGVSCTRKPIAVVGGVSQYNATSLTVDSNLGGLDVFWPQEAILPITSASVLQKLITETREQLAELRRRSDLDALPIGSIVPWYDKGKKPPAGWAPCDGSDDSKCPDLRNLFLVGGAANDVGNRGGGEQLTISIAGSNDAGPDGNGWSKDGGHYSYAYPVNVPKPPFVTVLYIRKIAAE